MYRWATHGITSTWFDQQLVGILTLMCRIVDILTIISRIMSCSVELNIKKSFITSATEN